MMNYLQKIIVCLLLGTAVVQARMVQKVVLHLNVDEIAHQLQLQGDVFIKDGLKIHLKRGYGNNSALVLYQIEDCEIGRIEFHIKRNGNGYIDLLVIKEEDRGKGYGSLLLEAAKAFLKNAGCASVSLTACPFELSCGDRALALPRLVLFYNQHDFNSTESWEYGVSGLVKMRTKLA